MSSTGIVCDTRFLGNQDAVEELLYISDLFLIPSGQESFGLAALETMACKVPVISSDIGGLPESQPARCYGLFGTDRGGGKDG